MIYIVGNGMFGRIARDMLEERGRYSVVIDNDEPNSGTKASGNITKPSWISGLGKEGKQAYQDLDRLYGLNKFSTELVAGKKIDLYYVAREKLQGKPDIAGTVSRVEDGWVQVGDTRYWGKILVAAGVWTDQLVSMPKIESMVGVSFLFKKPDDFKSRFNVWAPYRQSIAYDHNGVVWFGDGTAIKQTNWNNTYIRRSLDHAEDLELEEPMETHVGYRPYVKGHKEGYFQKAFENTWVSTGGGKNGLVLAAIQARKFVESIWP